MERPGRLLTAMVTPFDEKGVVDYEQAQKLALALLDSGSDGLVELTWKTKAPRNSIANAAPTARKPHPGPGNVGCRRCTTRGRYIIGGAGQPSRLTSGNNLRATMGRVRRTLRNDRVSGRAKAGAGGSPCAICTKLKNCSFDGCSLLSLIKCVF